MALLCRRASGRCHLGQSSCTKSRSYTQYLICAWWQWCGPRPSWSWARLARWCWWEWEFPTWPHSPAPDWPWLVLALVFSGCHWPCYQQQSWFVFIYKHRLYSPSVLVRALALASCETLTTATWSILLSMLKAKSQSQTADVNTTSKKRKGALKNLVWMGSVIYILEYSSIFYKLTAHVQSLSRKKRKKSFKHKLHPSTQLV